MTEFLSFRQVRFAALEFLSQAFLLCYVYGSADDAFQDPIVDDGNTDAPYITNLAVGSHNTLFDVTTERLRQHPLYRCSHGLAVFRVDKPKILVKRRRFVEWIEAVDLKEFPRPIVKKPQRVERPAPCVSKSLPFC